MLVREVHMNARGMVRGKQSAAANLDGGMKDAAVRQGFQGHAMPWPSLQ